MKANCLFCYYLNVKRARSKCGYWERSFGVCSIRDHHIGKSLRNCTKFSQIGPHYQGYIDWIEKTGVRLIDIAGVMNEQSVGWYQSSDTSTRAENE